VENYVLRVPDIGEGATEAEVVVWHVKPGDMVTEDQPVVDLMTDKATFEVTAPVSGKVLTINGSPGQKIAIASELIVFGNANASAGEEKAPAAAAPAPAVREVPAVKQNGKPPANREEAPVVEQKGTQTAKHEAPLSRQSQAQVRSPQDKPLASPVVRQKAREAGIGLQFVAGSGPAGRVSMEDLEKHIAAGENIPVSGHSRSGSYRERNGVEEVKVIGLRRQIAERMQEAKRRVPHFCYVEAVDVTELEEAREYLNQTRKPDQPKLTLLPFIIRALVKACDQYPQINAHFDDEAGILIRYEAVHVGIATQTDAGLMVPVIRHAETRSLWDSAEEVLRLAARARDRTAARDELSGSTITISSLGPLGGVVTTPIVNRPEVAIVGINKIVEQPVVRRGQIVIRKMMNLSSSFDHRVVDGQIAAEFIQKIKGLLETPVALVME
jgi:2-oxoisovalerate dehydrogenase E2 component (dihydrolipoyl transacylase)